MVFGFSSVSLVSKLCSLLCLRYYIAIVDPLWALHEIFFLPIVFFTSFSILDVGFNSVGVFTTSLFLKMSGSTFEIYKTLAPYFEYPIEPH